MVPLTWSGFALLLAIALVPLARQASSLDNADFQPYKPLDNELSPRQLLGSDLPSHHLLELSSNFEQIVLSGPSLQISPDPKIADNCQLADEECGPNSSYTLSLDDNRNEPAAEPSQDFLHQARLSTMYEIADFSMEHFDCFLECCMRIPCCRWVGTNGGSPFCFGLLLAVLYIAISIPCGLLI